MKLIRPTSIPKIDETAMAHLAVSEETLIRRAGAAVAKEILAVYKGGEVLILCGVGNNGADGYATALALRKAGVSALCADVLGKGQRSEGGRAVLADYVATVGAPIAGFDAFSRVGVSIVVDAILGSGASGPLSDECRLAARHVARMDAYKIAVDIPLGVDADLGEVQKDALSVDLTVMLAFPKRGLFSYPAKEKCGKLVLADLDMGASSLYREHFVGEATDDAFLLRRLPPRKPNTHKGSFGRLQIFAGSHKYRGAAHLVAHGAVRMGVGLVTLSTEEEVVRLTGRHLPELLFDPMAPITALTEAELYERVCATDTKDAVLIGPGCGVSEALYRMTEMLAKREGAPLLIDADALGAIAAYAPDVTAFFTSAKRALALTPHPLEFARLVGATAAEVQASRMRFALTYAKAWGVSLLLKGAGTLIADKKTLYVNTTGGPALAKGGSGDVLAGAVGSFIAQGIAPTEALALGAYLHGAAGDSLALELSEYGVTPSDLPRRMAELIAQKMR